MRTTIGRVAVVGLFALVTSSAPPGAVAQRASAAPARDISELWRIARYGEPVIVTSVAGQVLRGTLAEVMVDHDAVVVDVNEIRLQLPIDGIDTIAVKQRDPLGDGALKGALYGLGGSCILALMSKEGGFVEDFGAISLLTVPLGAFFGAYIDSAHDARRTIYRGPAGASGANTSRTASAFNPRAFGIRLVW